METICNARAWPQQCWKRLLCKRIQQCCATLRRSRKKKSFAQTFDKFQTSCNNSQQHATVLCKHTQHVTPNNVGSCCQQRCVRLHGACEMMWDCGYSVAKVLTLVFLSRNLERVSIECRKTKNQSNYFGQSKRTETIQ